jgi:5-methylcytosine-specific restriction endonuclease McrA
VELGLKTKCKFVSVLTSKKCQLFLGRDRVGKIKTTTMATKKKKATAKKSVTKKRTVAMRTTKRKPTTTKTVKKKISETVQLPIRPALVLTEEEQKLLQHHQTLKLQIELVPGSCWWSNVRSNVSAKQWDNIRIPVYKKANYLCEICGGKGTKHPVECHEVWIYDDTTLIQRLGFFQSLCPLCHEVKHIGLAGVRGNGDRAFNRFKEINQLDESSAKKIISAVFRQWNIRSRQQWKLDIEHLRQYGLNPNELKDKKDENNCH